MMATIALAVLAGLPAQPAGNLKFTNVRTTIGELGPARENNKLLPGDILFIAYDVEGITIDDKGNAEYTMTMEVVNAAGARVLPPPSEPKPEPRKTAEFFPLRGNKMPGRVFVTVGLDLAPGNYTCKVSITDTKSKASTNIDVKFEVAKKEFAVVALYTTYDARGEISAPTAGQVGQMVFVQFSVATFERDMKTKQPDVELSFQLFDDKGAPTMKEPLKVIQDATSSAAVAPIKESDGMFRVIPFPLYMNRPGKFVLEISATDRVSKKTASYKLPVTVNPSN
ncbi:hypothetical protein J8F10_21175 [Gemmata sp. G18]|uniref:Uncharacterized protein n=1 Tax=Gemmata palustris TaxID=2822762 RepID=A0ABS5BVM2_9BACT|nr:hypothetical protein [Gemmata palustris]MBP3957772.1 hypothetical protein [Gemmata palustris]